MEKSNPFFGLRGYSFFIGEVIVGVGEGIGADGWAAILRIVQRLSGVHRTAVLSEMKTVGEGRREDIEAIWQAAYSWKLGNSHGGIELIKTEDGRPGCRNQFGAWQRTWAGINQIIDMSEQEWQEFYIRF